MTSMGRAYSVAALAMAIVTGGAMPAQAQPAKADQKWSADFAIGFDNGISGHINASGIGTIDDQVAVITKNSYDDVYGNGLHLRFGGGYMLNEDTEIRGAFSFQSLDADFVVPMGDLGVSNLYGQFADYQTFNLDFGLRRYVDIRPKLKAYGEGTLGIGFVDQIDVTLVAPGANLAGKSTDFYDRTAAFTAGGNAGVMYQTGENVDVFVQLGLRYESGLAQVDQLIGTGLGTINDKSSRWTMPLLAGVRLRF